MLCKRSPTRARDCDALGVVRTAARPCSLPLPFTSSPMLATQTMSDPHATSTSASQTLVTPPELEQTLTLLTSHRSVLGYMLLSRGQPVTIIRHSGVVFEGEQGKKYASAIARIVHSVQTGLEDVSVYWTSRCLASNGRPPRNVHRRAIVWLVPILPFASLLHLVVTGVDV